MILRRRGLGLDRLALILLYTEPLSRWRAFEQAVR